MSRVLFLTTSSILFFSACGGGAAEQRIVTPFTAEHEPVFENGLDMVRDPSSLEGAWLSTWEDELDARVTLADAVALVTVETIRQDTDLDRRETFRLIVRVDREYLGDLEDQLTLAVRESDAGFGTIESGQRRVLDQQFIAFVKWQRDAETGAIRARWHLAQATDEVARRVRDLLVRRREVRQQEPGRRTVIIRRN